MKAMIAMSGGVDSAVAAYMMKEQGFDCVGATMLLTGNVSADTEDAAKIAATLGFEHYVLDLRKKFREHVIDSFIASYQCGETPNPCIECNKHIKWELMLKKAEEFGCDYLVTGHYARIEKLATGQFALKKALDEQKDQSYVLYNMTQSVLSKVILPLGNYSKSQIRQIAEQNGFINARKKDSQDICFVPSGDYAAFIEEYTGKKLEPGNFIDKNGKILGRHSGVLRYTIGQRKGLGIALGKPQYVCAKSVADNTVTLSDEDDLFSTELVAKDFNWISGKPPIKPERITARARYNQKEQPAVVYPLEDGCVKVVFDAPQRAITSGQSVVVYNGNTVLGGGIIL